MWQIEIAHPDDRPAALSLAFSRMAEVERTATIQRASLLLAKGTWTGDGIWIAREGAHLVGVVIAQPLRGASCLFWLPVARPDCADALIAAALAWCKSRGCIIAQAFYSPDQAEWIDPFLRNGFQRITRLHHLEYDFLLNAETDADAVGDLQFESCDPKMPAEFGATLLKTYEDSLDCPELDGRRNIDEILAGHRGEGVHHPDCWWLARHNGEAVGVLLLTEIVNQTIWEIAYLGITPAHRGQGWGRTLTLHALTALRKRNAKRLTLAVDARNTPARHLYESLGFTENEPMDVVLCFLNALAS